MTQLIVSPRTTPLPFGWNPKTPMSARTWANTDGAYLEIRDINGAPVATLTLSIDGTLSLRAADGVLAV